LGAVQQNSDGLYSTVNQPQVWIGNIAGAVAFSGLAPAYAGGLYQVNVQIPQNAPSGIQPLKLSVNGVISNTVNVAIQ